MEVRVFKLVERLFRPPYELWDIRVETPTGIKTFVWEEEWKGFPAYADDGGKIVVPVAGVLIDGKHFAILLKKYKLFHLIHNPEEDETIYHISDDDIREEVETAIRYGLLENPQSHTLYHYRVGEVQGKLAKDFMELYEKALQLNRYGIHGIPFIFPKKFQAGKTIKEWLELVKDSYLIPLFSFLNYHRGNMEIGNWIAVDSDKGEIELYAVDGSDVIEQGKMDKEVFEKAYLNTYSVSPVKGEKLKDLLLTFFSSAERIFEAEEDKNFRKGILLNRYAYYPTLNGFVLPLFPTEEGLVLSREHLLRLLQKIGKEIKI